MSASLIGLWLSLAPPETPLAPPAPGATTTTDPTLGEVNRRRLQAQWGVMGGLTGYAAVNIGAGVGFALQRDGTERYFHEMNVWWNSVNLIIGIVGLATLPKDARTERDEHDLRRKIKKSRRSFLVNLHLDLVYMSAGVASWGSGRVTRIPRLEGYGQSFVLQGGVLLALDLTMYLVHGANLRRLERAEGRDFRLMPYLGMAEATGPDGRVRHRTPVTGLGLSF